MAAPFASLHNSLPMPDVGNDPLAQLQGLGMPGANLTPPMMPAASPMTPLGGPSPVQLGAAPMRPAPALPQIPTQTGMPWWANLIPLAAAIGARMGGSPQMGTGVMQGWMQGQQLQQEQLKQQQAVVQAQREEALRKYQLQLQADQMKRQAEQFMRQEAQAAQDRRDRAIQSSLSILRDQTFKTRESYEAAVAAHDTMLQQGYNVRPGLLKRLVPYESPNVQAVAARALEPMLKEHGLNDLLQNRGVNVMIDTDGTGARPVPFKKALELAGIAYMVDPVTQEAVRVDVPPDKVDELQSYYQAVIQRYKNEGRDVADPIVRGKAMEEARRNQEQIRKLSQGPVQGELKDIGGRLWRIVGDRAVPVFAPDGTPLVTESKDDDPSIAYARNSATQMLEQIDLLLGPEDNPRVNNWTVGTWANAQLQLPIVSPARDFEEDKKTLLAQIAFNALTEMRAASKTGGALGQVSNIELSLLQNSLAALESTLQSPEQYKRNLLRARASVERWLRAKTGESKPEDVLEESLREKAREVLEGMQSPSGQPYDTSDASVDRFLASPQNRAALLRNIGG